MREEQTVKPFIGYEYKEIFVPVENVSMMIDCYENFGWERDENIIGFNEGHFGKRGHGSINYHVKLLLKRDRKIMNKMELTRLQRNFESCVREIESLEKSKTSLASMYALVIGFIGTVFMAGSVFAVTAQPPHILLCMILAIPAFLGWILPLFVYRKTNEVQIAKVTPYIEAKYDEIYEICEKGNRLLQ